MKHIQTISNYKYLFFDFDGVLFDSNEIRKKGFQTIFQEFPKSLVDQLINYHDINGGLSRYHKIRYFFENIKGTQISDDLLKKYTTMYADFMKKNLFSKEFKIFDSINFIIKNIDSFKKIFIVSGSDQVELRNLCEFIEISYLFDGIYGSPTTKNDLVRDILNENNLEPNMCCLIGDSLNDKEAASINKIDFIGYNNSKLICENKIKTFSELK